MGEEMSRAASKPGAEDYVHKNLVRYRRLFETAPCGIIILDSRLEEIRDANSFITTLLGSSLEELIGKKLWELDAFPDKKLITHVLKEVKEKGAIAFTAMPMQTKEGKRVATEFTASIFDSDDEQVIQCHIRNISQHITEASELRYRRLFESAQDGVLILDFQSGQIVDANPFIIDLLGFSHEELAGKELWEIGFFVDKALALHAYEELQKNNYIRYDDLPLKNKQGKIINVEFVSNVYDVMGEKVIQCNIRDISERKLLADAKNSSELRYRRLFESAQDGILILDFKSGEIVDANPFIIDLLGFSLGELSGKELWEIGFVIDKEMAIHAYQELQSKSFIRYEDLPLRNKNGKIINVEFVSNVYDVEGKKVIQCNIRDISDRKNMLEYQHAISLSMEEMVDALVAMVETRDPYTAGHQARVAELAVAIATELHYPPNNLAGLKMSAMVHDNGKYTVSSDVLTKPTPLTDFEIEMLRSHSHEGYKILKLIRFPWPVAQTILQHHERLDGSGYPAGLKGDSISEEARIIGVADTVEAMSSYRPYRAAMGQEMALAYIEQERGKLFDPKIVDICLKLFREKGFKFSESPIENLHKPTDKRDFGRSL